MLIVLACIFLVLAFVLWLRLSVLIVAVNGRSMLPTYRHGEHVLALRRIGRIRTGHVLILRAPGDDGGGLIVKRVAAVGGDLVPRTTPQVEPAAERVPARHLVMLGDYPNASADSRHWGFISSAEIRGRVVGRLDWFAQAPDPTPRPVSRIPN
jgi:signal peptidase I